MYFNSYEFIFLFLPVAIGGYFMLGATKYSRLANVWLLLAGLFFYGYWEIKYLFLLVGSITINFFIARKILAAIQSQKDNHRKMFFAAGLIFNVALLGYFKYTDFILENINLLFGLNIALPHIELPLGISFFTITQLICLYDCQAGLVKKNGFLDYALFVSFFPHLLAGPILYHRSMMKQFRDAALRRVNWENMSEGLTLFIIGLVKKVVVADSFIVFVNNGFGAADNLTFFHAWLVGFGYIAQLYFDFSGYSDMAIGASKMMNLTIPINFNAPLRAKSLTEFWQRWHISLTNAATGCLYQPLLRSFAKPQFRHVVLVSFITFFIIGVWHGAGWTFVIFALLHAFGVVVNHFWRRYGLKMPNILAHITTLGYLTVSLMFFRADNVSQAVNVVKGMFGLHGVLFPQGITDFAAEFLRLGLPMGHIFTDFPLKTFAVAVFVIIFAPPSTKLVKKIKPNPILATALALIFVYAVSLLGETTDFLYFQF